MNVVEKSKFISEDGLISLKDRLSATIDYGLDWYGIMQSQDFVTQRLGRVLNDKHYLLRNIAIPGIDQGQPLMVLVSPQGVRLILALPSRGVFRAKDDEWLRFDTRTRKFRSSQPNLQTKALELLKSVRQLMEIQGLSNIESEAVLIFTNPRTLIDSARPITRVVSADAIEYFAGNIEQNDPTINPDRVHRVVDALIHPQIPDPELAAELLAAIEPEQSVPTFEPQESVWEPEWDEGGETIQRLESFFQQERYSETFPSEEPESEHTPAFYPESLEEFDQGAFQGYEGGPSHASREAEYQLPADSLARADESYGFTQDPYASPDPFSPARSYVPSTPDKPASYPKKPERKRSRISGGQWILLALLGIIEFGILLYFAYVIFLDLDLF